MTVIRSFRIARIASLFKRTKALKTSVNTFIVSLPAMVNIGSLILLVVFIYSILGVYLFSDVKLNGALNEHANFQSVRSSFITLIRTSTGENWPKIMMALSRENEPGYECIYIPSFDDFVKNQNQPIGCGNRFFARTFFSSYCLIVPMIFMKLFIAIIL